MNLPELNMSGIGTGDIKLDEKVDCRTCFASEVFICGLRDHSRGRGEFKRVYLQFSVVYIPVLQLYFAKWDLRDDIEPPQQHRTIVKSWGGGLWVIVQATEHLKEAIKLSIARVVAGEYASTASLTIEPSQNLLPEFKDAGWVEPVPETGQ